jgi:hypothetical protein
VISAPADHSNDGVHTITYYSTDKATNQESDKSATVRIDTVKPNSSILCNGVACAGTYYNADVTVNLSGTDSGGSNLKEIRYTTDGSTPDASHGTAIASGGAFSVSSTTTVKFVAVDNAGNVESPVNSQTINIDKANPSSSILCNGAACAASYYNADVTVTLSGTDSGDSGLKEIRYTTDGSTPDASHGTAIASGSTFVVSAATTVKFVAVDNAGNVESPVNSQTINIDKVAPTVTINQALTQTDPTSTAPIRFTAVFSEPVTDFSNTDVTVSGTAGGMLAANVYPTADPKVYDVKVNGMTTGGTVVATIGANKAQDQAGNGNTASTSDDNSVTWQPAAGNTAPVVTINSPTFGTVYAKGAPGINPLSVNASFVDPDNGPWTYTINWDDNGALSTGAATPYPSTFQASHPFLNPGVYTINVCVKDSTGTNGCASVWIVVYDPNGGFVTGGGWITVSSGSSTTYPSATGRANFGFNSQYKKNANIPTGETEFNFQVGTLNFHSTAYSWLVVSNFKAQYKGTGTINGTGNYSFTLTAYDGDITGGGGVDKFRIQITDDNTHTLVFDNRKGVPTDIDTADPQAIAGGSIVIHKA